MEANKRFSYLTSEIDAVYHEIALKLGLSDSAMWILYIICLQGESCLLSEIISLSGISKQTVNSALRKLEKDGILYLEAAKGKKKLVCLTVQGKELAQNTVRQILHIEDEIFSEWAPDELELYMTLTEKYLFSLKEKIKKLPKYSDGKLN